MQQLSLFVAAVFLTAFFGISMAAEDATKGLRPLRAMESEARARSPR
jgi:hypothetical protein